MSVVYVLTTPIPNDGGDDPSVEQVRKRAKWDNDNYVCRGLILNGMSDHLFDIYQNVESSKKQWNSLEAKYMAEDATIICALRNPSGCRIVTSQKATMLLVLQLSIWWSITTPSSTMTIRVNVKHHDNTRADPNKKAKPTCWKCGKTGHIKRDCKCVNVGNKGNGLGTKGSVDGSSYSLKAFMSTSKLNDSILRHARLGHVHFKRMQDMSKYGLIPTFNMDIEKYKTCMLTKITKKPFQNVKRVTKVLELIHSELCDLDAIPSLGNKK
nr:zinc finger, CCHC-type [Tanacetum cinerariifolium]